MASIYTAGISFTVESCVHGYHIFQHAWIHREGSFAVVVKKGEDIVRHGPRQFSCASSLFLQSGGLLACEVSVDRHYSHDLLNSIGGMEISCVYIFSGVPDLVNKTKQWLR